MRRAPSKRTAPGGCCAMIADGDAKAPAIAANIPIAIARRIHRFRWHRSAHPLGWACDPACSRTNALDLLRTSVELLVLETDEFNQLGVDEQSLIDANRPRLRVRLRIVNRDVDLQRAEVGPAEPLDRFAR